MNAVFNRIQELTQAEQIPNVSVSKADLILLMNSYRFMYTALKACGNHLIDFGKIELGSGESALISAALKQAEAQNGE